MSELSTRLHLRRKELGLSQEELAQRMGYRSKSSITKLEKGINDLPQSKVEELAAALETTPAGSVLGLDTPCPCIFLCIIGFAQCPGKLITTGGVFHATVNTGNTAFHFFNSHALNQTGNCLKISLTAAGQLTFLTIFSPAPLRSVEKTCRVDAMVEWTEKSFSMRKNVTTVDAV